MSRVIVVKDIRILLVKAMWTDSSGTVKEAQVGVTHDTVASLKSHGARARFFQLQSIVASELIDAKHIFQGLNRPMFSDGDMAADGNKLVYTWKPRYDYDRDDFDPEKPKKHYFPKDKTFVVIVSPMRDIHRHDYPMIEGWINHWGIVDEDEHLDEAPVDWQNRFKRKLWSKN